MSIIFITDRPSGSDSKLLKLETYCKINCQDQLKQVDAGSEWVNHVKVTFYLDSKRVWPLNQQPSHANMWRFHYERSQVPAHTDARGPGNPATSPGGCQATIQFPTRHRLTQLAAISPLYSLHFIPCQPMSTQVNPTSARWRQGSSYSPYNAWCDWLKTWVAEVNL